MTKLPSSELVLLQRNLKVFEYTKCERSEVVMKGNGKKVIHSLNEGQRKENYTLIHTQTSLDLW